MEEQRLLRHQGKLRAQRLLRRAGNLLPIDQNPPFIQVVKPLQKLHESRLAGARMSDQAHTFAGRNAQREVLEERLSLRAVTESDAVEQHLTLVYADRLRIRPVGHA